MSPPQTKRYALTQLAPSTTTINDPYDSDLFRTNPVVRTLSGKSPQPSFPAIDTEFVIPQKKPRPSFWPLFYNLSIVCVCRSPCKIGIRLVLDSKDWRKKKKFHID